MRPQELNSLFAESVSLPGIGPRLAALIEKVAGAAVIDLLLTMPHSIIDRSARPKISEAALGDLVTLEVTVDRHEPGSSKKRPYRVLVSDETGFLTLAFFHARKDYLEKVLPEGEKRLISGRIDDYDGSRQMTHPDFIVDPKSPEELPLFEPVYPLTAGLTANTMRKAVAQAIKRTHYYPSGKTLLIYVNKVGTAGTMLLFRSTTQRLVRRFPHYLSIGNALPTTNCFLTNWHWR